MTISITISRSTQGEPTPAPGIAGAFGATKPSNESTDSVEINFDKDDTSFEDAVAAAAVNASFAFRSTFLGEGEPLVASTKDEPEEPHVCGPECGLPAGLIVEVPSGVDPVEAIRMAAHKFAETLTDQQADESKKEQD